MEESLKNFNSSCYRDCESFFRECMNSKEHESVCQMKHAQCVCGCIVE